MPRMTSLLEAAECGSLPRVSTLVVIIYMRTNDSATICVSLPESEFTPKAAEHRAFGADYVEHILFERRRDARAQSLGPLSLLTAPDLADIALEDIDLGIYDRALGNEEDDDDDEAAAAGLA